MKTKIDKKTKKRSLSETSLSIKSNQKQKTITGSKKSPKKTKLVGLVQNGNSTMENKVQILKKMYKQKEKPKIKQTNTGSLAEIKTEGTKLPIAKLNEESVGKKTKTKEKKLKNLQIKQVKRELRKKKRRNRHVLNAASITLSTEEIEAKIEEIRSREVLSKRAKKILSVLNRKLRLEKSALDKSEKNIIGKKDNKKNQQVGTFVKTESVSNKDKKDKIKIKKEHEHETIKREKDDQNDSNIMKTENEDEDESDEDQNDTETEESMHDANEQLDDESEDKDTEDDEDDEEDEEDEDDETDENDEDEEANTSQVKKEEKKPKIQAKQSLEHQKKNQYVLFVGNLPTDVTADELKQHFLTKIDTVSNVRIPIKSDTKTPRGFAFVEVTNSTDLEKGLSLHHTIIKNRRIIVKPNENKKMNVGKNFGFVKNFGITKKKPQAFQKAKKLTSGNQGKKKPLKKEKQS